MTDIDDDDRDPAVTAHQGEQPRPAAEDHPAHAGPGESRRIPPSGRVSPDGSRPWPTPSPTARLLVWGGTAVATAAVTALAVHLGRKLGKTLQDTPPAPVTRRRSAPPRFVDLDEDELAALRARARARARRAAHEAADQPRRAPAPKTRRRRRKPDFTAEVSQRTQDLSHGVSNAMAALTTALTGFRGVAGQASHIMREFNDAATLIGGFMGRTAQAARDAADRAKRDAADRAKRDASAATHKTGDDIDKTASEERRMHRL